MKSDISMMVCVSAGILALPFSMSVKIFWNCGTTNIMRIATIATATPMMTIGYTIALLTLLVVLSAFSWNVESLSSTTSRTPPASPALAMLT